MSDITKYIYEIRYSGDTAQDIDGDGRNDIYRTFHRNGRLASIRLGASKSYYNKHGKIKKWERLSLNGIVLERVIYPGVKIGFVWKKFFDRNKDLSDCEVVFQQVYCPPVKGFKPIY